MQQLSISFGVATASLAAAVFIPDRLRATPPQLLHGIHLALLGLATLTIVSTVVFARLRAEDGAAVSRHKSAVPIRFDPRAADSRLRRASYACKCA